MGDTKIGKIRYVVIKKTTFLCQLVAILISQIFKVDIFQGIVTAIS